MHEPVDLGVFFSVGGYGTGVWSSSAAVVASLACAGHCVGGISPPPRQPRQEESLRWVACIIDSSVTTSFSFKWFILSSSEFQTCGSITFHTYTRASLCLECYCFCVSISESQWLEQLKSVAYVWHLHITICVFLSVCTPFGLSRMFSVTGSLLVKPRVSNRPSGKNKALHFT